MTYVHNNKSCPTRSFIYQPSAVPLLEGDLQWWLQLEDSAQLPGDDVLWPRDVVVLWLLTCAHLLELLERAVMQVRVRHEVGQ